MSYEIAGTFYADINKVKSKARAILNLKKDGEKLTGNDEEFIKELIKFHEKHDEKMNPRITGRLPGFVARIRERGICS